MILWAGEAGGSSPYGRSYANISSQDHFTQPLGLGRSSSAIEPLQSRGEKRTACFRLEKDLMQALSINPTLVDGDHEVHSQRQES